MDTPRHPSKNLWVTIPNSPRIDAYDLASDVEWFSFPENRNLFSTGIWEAVEIDLYESWISLIAWTEEGSGNHPQGSGEEE